MLSVSGNWLSQKRRHFDETFTPTEKEEEEEEESDGQIKNLVLGEAKLHNDGAKKKSKMRSQFATFSREASAEREELCVFTRVVI